MPTTPSKALPRIASLVPSLTELVFALGLGPHVVARTGFCIHPAEGVGAVPKVGGTKDVNLDKLRRLAPSHVLVNVDENRLDTVNALREFVPHVLVTHPCTPEDNLALVDQIQRAFGNLAPVPERARSLRRDIEQALRDTQAAGRPARRVLYLIWRDPWMTVARDTYLSQMLARVNWLTEPEAQGGPSGAARYPVLRGDEPWLAAVELVLLSSEPYRFDTSHLSLARALCPNAQALCVDGEALSWYGPRAVAGLSLLRQLANAPLR